MGDEERDIEAIEIDTVEDLEIINGADFAARVMLKDVDHPVYVTMSEDTARLLTELLLLKGPPSIDEHIDLEFPADLNGEFAASDVQVERPDPELSSLPFQFTFRIGERAVRLRLSHLEVVRWHRRIGAQIREHAKRFN